MSNEMTPDVSIIICTRNRKGQITATLDSIFENSYPDFEVIIIDQSVDNETQTAIEPFLSDLRLNYKRTNTRGLSKARNIGLSKAQGTIIAFTDDDCRVSTNWIKSIFDQHTTHPDVDSIFGRIIPGNLPTSSEQTIAFNFSQAERLQQVLPIAKKDDPTPQLYKDNPNNLGFGHGANMSFKRPAFTTYGVFDEFLGAGAALGAWEDRDIGHRILFGSGQILYSPDIVVHHDHWREWLEVKTAYKNYALGTGTAVNKYLRSGDWGGFYLLLDWFIQLGIRQLFSGIFKWQSWQKISIGISQLIYPWVGFIKGFNYHVDHKKKVYIDKKTKGNSYHQSTDELIDTKTYTD